MQSSDDIAAIEGYRAAQEVSRRGGPIPGNPFSSEAMQEAWRVGYQRFYEEQRAPSQPKTR